MELSAVLIRKLDSGPTDLTELFKQRVLLHYTSHRGYQTHTGNNLINAQQSVYKFFYRFSYSFTHSFKSIDWPSTICKALGLKQRITQMISTLGQFEIQTETSPTPDDL